MKRYVENAVGLAAGIGILVSGCGEPKAVPIGAPPEKFDSPETIKRECFEEERSIKEEKRIKKEVEVNPERPMIITVVPTPEGDIPEIAAQYFPTEAQIELAKRRKEDALKVIDEYIQPHNRDGWVLLLQPPVKEYYHQWLDPKNIPAQVMQQDSQTAQDISLSLEHSPQGNLEAVIIQTDLQSKKGMAEVLDKGGKIKQSSNSDHLLGAIKQTLTDFYILPEGFDWKYYSDARDMNDPKFAVIGRGSFADGREVLLYASFNGSWDEGMIIVHYPVPETEKKRIEKKVESPQ